MDSVSHFEITADDNERAKTFYQDVFGWKIDEVPGLDYSMVYTVDTDPKTFMPKKPGAINGGLMKKDDTASSPVIVITVDSLDDKLKAVEAAGGSVVMPKREIPKMGYYARVKDTEDNVIGIWEDLPKK